jgi:hypothetical protein
MSWAWENDLIEVLPRFPKSGNQRSLLRLPRVETSHTLGLRLRWFSAQDLTHAPRQGADVIRIVKLDRLLDIYGDTEFARQSFYA